MAFGGLPGPGGPGGLGYMAFISNIRMKGRLLNAGAALPYIVCGFGIGGYSRRAHPSAFGGGKNYGCELQKHGYLEPYTAGYAKARICHRIALSEQIYRNSHTMIPEISA
jgi:hypothetical protein